MNGSFLALWVILRTTGLFFELCLPHLTLSIGLGVRWPGCSRWLCTNKQCGNPFPSEELDCVLCKGLPNSRNPQVTSAVGAGWGPRWTLRGQEKASLLAAFTVEKSQKIICTFNNGKLNDGGIFDCLNKPSRAGEGYCYANYRLLLLTADHRGDLGLPKGVHMAGVGVKEQGGEKAATPDILMTGIWILLHLTFSPF